MEEEEDEEENEGWREKGFGSVSRLGSNSYDPIKSHRNNLTPVVPTVGILLQYVINTVWSS